MTDQGVLGRERFRPRATALEAPLSRLDRLDSWKEIANHLGREVRTVQLWEKREGLPVHRHFHRSLSSVFAFRSEVDAWCQRVSRASVDPQGQPDARTDSNPNSARRIQERVTVAVLPFHAPPGTPELEWFNEGPRKQAGSKRSAELYPNQWVRHQNKCQG